MPFSDLIYVDETGLHTPDYPTVLEYYLDSVMVIYGDDINLDADTKDGQYIGIFAASAFDFCQIAQACYNSFSPLTAIGRALSSQVLLNGIAREIATKSQVDLYLVGQIGTQILNGIASDTLGQKWDLPASVVIPLSGDITVTATAQEEGSATAEANTVTTIFTAVRGWQSVDNPSPATAGVAVETDAELRARQKISTSYPALTVFESTTASVAAIEGVQRFRSYENFTDLTDANGIPPHSISIVVDGGDDVEVAQAIWDKKTPGTGTYGTTSELIFDEYGTPSNISFYRPTVATIGVTITIEALQGFVSTTSDLIKLSVAEYINSSRIGDDIYISRLYTPANLNDIPEGATYDITILQIKKNAGPFVSVNLDLTFIEVPECAPLVDITVIVI